MLPLVADLRHRVQIQVLVETSDGQGGMASTWHILDTVWAKLEPTNSSERFFANQLQYQRSHKCWMRYRSDVNETMRLYFDSRYFQIKAVSSPDEKGFWMVMDLQENQGT